MYSEILSSVPFACAGIPTKSGNYDTAHLFIEEGELSESERQSLKKSVMDFSAQISALYQISGFHFVDKLPITSVGKVKRFLLKEIALIGNAEKS